MDDSIPPPITPEIKTPRPLLPPVLLGPSAILWLWVLPVLILLALNLQGYRLIEGNMDAAQHTRAHLFGAAGLVNLLAGLGLFAAARYRMRRASAETPPPSVWWSVPVVGVQVAYLWLAVAWCDYLLPGSVTAWIYPETRFLYYQFAFAMPALFWGILRLACARPAKVRGKVLLINLSLVIGAPVLLYVFFRLLMAYDHWPRFAPSVVAIIIIGLGLVMFVALVRGMALGLRDMGGWRPASERVAILVFALMLPLGGLALNREIPFPNDFQSWEVYALTILNAVILLFASWWHERRPLLSLGLLCVTLPFTLYFFVVFLPFLPLSIVAVIAMGAGFLVLAPTVLLILHLSLLNKARRGSRGRRLVTGMLCFLLLPAFFTIRGLADKAALNAALDYVYAPAIKAGPIAYGSSRVNLKRALANHRSYKNGIYYPLLSDYYAWLVFDDLVLPDDKLARLENAFFGKAGPAENNDRLGRNRGGIFDEGRGGSSNRDRNRMPRSPRPPRTVDVEKMDVRSTPSEGGATVVTLALTLRNTGSVNAEYAKTLPLPAGIFVSGFRLKINGVAVPGRITEKKTALWVYSMIRDSERRDPGLLFYNSPGELELRVFPVVANTPSVVEIDFLAPAALVGESLSGGSDDPSGLLAQLDERLRPRIAQVGDARVVAGGLARLALPVAKRECYLHVIVDRSADNGFDGDLSAAVDTLRKKFPFARTPRITLTNYETVELGSPADGLAALPLRGGFVPDLALAQALREHRDRDLDAGTAGGPPARPVFVVLSRKAKAHALDLEVAPAWRDLVPTLEVYEMDAAGGFVTLQSSDVADAPLLRLGGSVRPWVRGLATRFKAAGEGTRLEYWSPETSAWSPIEGVAGERDDTPWVRAVGLQVQQQDYVRTPGDAAVNLKALVQASRASGVMLASTSYIVVENSAQWRMLDVSERKKLDQNAALNFKEAPAPSWVWLGAGFLLWLGVRRWRAVSRKTCGA